VGSTAPTGTPLVGRTIRLDLMAPGDAEGLHAVFGDPANYTDGYLMHPPAATLDDTRALMALRMEKGGGHTAYTARLVADGTVVGTSSIGDIDLGNERAHIGWTMWGRPWWGTAVNPEAKLLMLTHCFEDCGFGRVKIQTDLHNHHSQAAIAKLGAQREGVLRRHTKRADGTWRDTVVFSVVVDEWPAVKARLEARLAAVPPEEGR
jgi:RimJ/RimL family protein N-acetyltransferase